MMIKDRTVFITGSSERVGRTIALSLARSGARVVIHFHTRENEALQTAQEVTSMVGWRPLIVQGDISQKADWIRMRDEILEKHGTIDVLVNNAAIFHKTPFFDTDEAEWDRFMSVNLKSVFLGSQIIGKTMYEQKQGKIINIADVSAYKVWSEYIPYCVSKAGVISLTKGLAKALAPYVLVNAIAPGTVLLAKEHDPSEEKKLIKKTPLKRVGSPEDIANTVAFLIEGSEFITGEVITVDGGRSLT